MAELDYPRRAVLNSLLAQTNDHQGDWTDTAALRTVAVAHGSLTPAEFNAALGDLVEKGLVETREDDLRSAGDADRIPHPGEM
jgi:hypothetical protein